MAWPSLNVDTISYTYGLRRSGKRMPCVARRDVRAFARANRTLPTTSLARAVHEHVLMRLTSTAFADGDEIPTKYTCEGEDVSPPLSWSDVPVGTRSLALVVDDPDAPDPAAPTRTWVHWVVVDLPPDTERLSENVSRLARGHLGVNDWNRVAWGGPCPPIGRHRYVFTLYALDRVLELARASKAELERAIAGHVLGKATLVGTYQKRRR